MRPARLRYPEPGPANLTSLAHTLAMIPMYATQMGGTLIGLRRTHALTGKYGLVWFTQKIQNLAQEGEASNFLL